MSKGFKVITKIAELYIVATAIQLEDCYVGPTYNGTLSTVGIIEAQLFLHL